MQRIINDPDNIVDEMLEGFLKTHSDLVERSENGRVVKSIHMEPGRTGVVTGGGSGHKPAFIGYVGCGRRGRDMLFSHCRCVFECLPCGRPRAGRCLSIRKLFWGQHECQNGCKDGC